MLGNYLRTLHVVHSNDIILRVPSQLAGGEATIISPSSLVASQRVYG